MELLDKMLPHLDKHLALGLLSHYAQKGEDVGEAAAKLIESTGLTLDGTVRPEHEEKMKPIAAIAQPALEEFFEKWEDGNSTYQFKLTETEVTERRAQSELAKEFLAGRKKITEPVITAVFQLAYMYYDMGAYGDASELLALCQCVSGYDSLPSETILWGKLMSDIGACNWTSAHKVAEEIRRVQNASEEDLFGSANTTSIRARVWLLHWVLFPFFLGGNQLSVQLLFYVFDYRNEAVYRKVVETVCPYYLRYICAAVLLNRNRQGNFADAAALTESIYEYSDPLTKLVSYIHRSSFDEANAILPEVSAAIQGDYFLAGHEEEILDNARRLIFQRYMAVHSVVSIPFVAEQLGMSKTEAEVWLVNLISDSSRQRAKIDSVNEQLNVEPRNKALDTVIFEKLDAASR